jgi:hypothetical protein
MPQLVYSVTTSGAEAFAIPLAKLIQDLDRYIQINRITIGSSANVVVELDFFKAEPLTSTLVGAGELRARYAFFDILAHTEVAKPLKEAVAWNVQGWASAAADLNMTIDYDHKTGDIGQEVRALAEFIQDWDGLDILPEWND